MYGAGCTLSFLLQNAPWLSKFLFEKKYILWKLYVYLELISILDVHFIICMVWHVDWCLIWILDVAITKIFRIFFWKCFATVTHETFSPVFILSLRLGHSLNDNYLYRDLCQNILWCSVFYFLSFVEILIWDVQYMQFLVWKQFNVF